MNSPHPLVLTVDQSGNRRALKARARAEQFLRLGAVVAAFMLLVGCDSSDDGPREWLSTVCGSEAQIAAPPADRSYDDYDAEDTLTCTRPEHSDGDYYYCDAVAFRTNTDPADQLLAAVDGWESGDGMEFRYATQEIGTGTWAVVLSVAPAAEIKQGLDRLEGFKVYGSDEVFGGAE